MQESKKDDNLSMRDNYGNCDGYYTMRIKNDLFDGNNDELQKKELFEKLLYLSDRNCITFKNRFYFNEMITKSGGEIVSMNLFGLGGINLGGVEQITAAQLLALNSNLERNLKKRNKLKSAILEKIEYEKPFILLSDIASYDSLCGLYPTNEIEDLNVTVSSDKWVRCDFNETEDGHKGKEYYKIDTKNKSVCKYSHDDFTLNCTTKDKLGEQKMTLVIGGKTYTVDSKEKVIKNDEKNSSAGKCLQITPMPVKKNDSLF